MCDTNVQVFELDIKNALISNKKTTKHDRKKYVLVVT